MAFGAKAFGWPARSLSGLKGGDYTVQAVPKRYESLAYPDPIDFRAEPVINRYKERKAYELRDASTNEERPASCNYLGEVFQPQRDGQPSGAGAGRAQPLRRSVRHLAGRLWPKATDGYPQPIWDKVTGDIDPKVAAYWCDHSDLTYILQRNWKALGPKLAGKLHIYVGCGDTYLFDDADYYVEETLQNLNDSAWGGEVAYGAKDEHRWNGDPTLPNVYAGLHYNFMYLPMVMGRPGGRGPDELAVLTS